MEDIIYSITDIMEDEENPDHYVAQLSNNGEIYPYFQIEILELVNEQNN